MSESDIDLLHAPDNERSCRTNGGNPPLLPIRNADDEAFAFMATIAEDAERREAREREEWTHVRSTVGGITMTGAEWATFAKRLREDDDVRQRVIDAFKKRGMSDAEAVTRYERVADVAAIPESQRTEAQAAIFARTQADPTFKQDMKDADHAVQIDGLPKGASMPMKPLASPAAEGELSDPQQPQRAGS